MNLGVLLLFCKDTARVTTFTRDWAQAAIQNVAAYLKDQSGGREILTFKVFDWYKMDKTAQEWVDLGTGAYSVVGPEFERDRDEDLSPFTHILIGIDHPLSSGGTTFGKLTHLAAANFTPSLISHELGHRFGANDASGETPDGPAIYENRWCVMGALGFPWTFPVLTLKDPMAPGLNEAGPGMSAPTLMATGWLDPTQHGVAADLTDYNLEGGVVQELSVLTGAPGPEWSRPPLVVRYKDLLIEYRIPAPNGWDRGLERTGPGAEGWIVVHRSPPEQSPAALFVASQWDTPGLRLVMGKDNSFDVFSPGPLTLSILSHNKVERTVRVYFSRRARREPPSVLTFGGTRAGGGGVIFTPGGGWTPVPPHSPLLDVLQAVSNVHALQELLPIATHDEKDALTAATSRALAHLGESVANLQAVPSSPIAQALGAISELKNVRERLESSPYDNSAIKEFLDLSGQRLNEVSQILTDAVEKENGY